MVCLLSVDESQDTYQRTSMFLFQTMRELVHDVGNVSLSTLMEATPFLKSVSITGQGPIPARVSYSSLFTFINSLV